MKCNSTTRCGRLSNGALVVRNSFIPFFPPRHAQELFNQVVPNGNNFLIVTARTLVPIRNPIVYHKNHNGVFYANLKGSGRFPFIAGQPSGTTDSMIMVLRRLKFQNRSDNAVYLLQDMWPGSLWKPSPDTFNGMPTNRRQRRLLQFWSEHALSIDLHCMSNLIERRSIISECPWGFQAVPR